MRILHVTDAYLPKQGGIEVQVRELSRQQLAAGAEVSVLTCAPPAGRPGAATWTMSTVPVADPVDGGPQVYRMGIPWPHIPQSNAAIHDLLASLAPDAVHVHLSVLSPLSILAVRAAARRRIPVVVTLHSLWWWATSLYAIANTLLGWGRWPVHWTAVSELAADPLRALVRSPGEVSVLPNGVEPGQWQVAPLPREDTEVVAVSVMRLALRKRPRALVDAVDAAVRRLPTGVRLRVVVVGDGPQRGAIARRIRRRGLAGVIELAGRLEHEQIRELYRRADLYLAPATLESFGIAALEARCAGLPVIARRQTGIADFIHHGRHGLLAASDLGLAAALVELATDPGRRRAMAERNRASVPDTGWAEVLQRCDLSYKLARELSQGAAVHR
jgi:glycosyltransferase involved in cell wall biosynthesis